MKLINFVRDYLDYRAIGYGVKKSIQLSRDTLHFRRFK